MEKFDEKQRKIIRLAYACKDPELRRQAVERVVTARYKPEFKEWANSQGAVFTHPETQNQVRFNSLNSQAQKEVYNRWDAGEYYDRGGPAPKGQGGEKEKGEKKEKGSKHADRTELRGKASKSMEDSAGLTEKDIYDLIPKSKLDKARTEPKGLRGDDIKAAMMSFNFGELDQIHSGAEYMAKYGVDDDYSKGHWLVKVVGMDQEEVNEFYKGLRRKLEKAKGRLYAKSVLEIANEHDLEGEDADAIHQFRKDKPLTGRRLTPEQLKQKFLAGDWADAETKARVREMTGDEFMAMRNAIFDEDEEELAGAVEGEAAASVAASVKTSGEEEEEVEGEEPWSDLNLLEAPPKGGDKKASLTPLGRKIVRMAYKSTDKEVRRKLVRRAKAELNS